MFALFLTWLAINAYWKYWWKKRITRRVHFCVLEIEKKRYFCHFPFFIITIIAMIWNVFFNLYSLFFELMFTHFFHIFIIGFKCDFQKRCFTAHIRSCVALLFTWLAINDTRKKCWWEWDKGELEGLTKLNVLKTNV